MIDGELGVFIRNRREAVRPGDVGLPEGTRRRTPGLRRSELATLAGISVEYLIRLEQGRDANPSTQVLAAIADALRLDADDVNHLQQLSVIGNGTDLLCAQQCAAAPRSVRPNVRTLLDNLEPTPAYVVNHLDDLLAWNDAYDALMRPSGLLDGDEPNLVTFVFADARARDTYRDWDAVADAEVASLYALRQADLAADAFAERLGRTAGPSFSDRWERRPLDVRPTGFLGITHPDAGDLRLAYETLQLPDNDRQRLVVYLPADAAASAGLDRIAGRRPGGLRAVEGIG